MGRILSGRFLRGTNSPGDVFCQDEFGRNEFGRDEFCRDEKSARRIGRKVRGDLPQSSPLLDKFRKKGARRFAAIFSLT